MCITVLIVLQWLTFCGVFVFSWLKVVLLSDFAWCFGFRVGRRTSHWLSVICAATYCSKAFAVKRVAWSSISAAKTKCQGRVKVTLRSTSDSSETALENIWDSECKVLMFFFLCGLYVCSGQIFCWTDGTYFDTSMLTTESLKSMLCGNFSYLVVVGSIPRDGYKLPGGYLQCDDFIYPVADCCISYA